jgi:CDP-paratose 2-epimerase
VPEARPGDVPYYVSDCGRLHARSGWRARRGPRDVLADTFEWIRDNERAVLAALD